MHEMFDVAFLCGARRSFRRRKAKESTNEENRGSAFLKNWMAYLEENADLRYPTLDDIGQEDD
jgi:hypothetical protein